MDLNVEYGAESLIVWRGNCTLPHTEVDDVISRITSMGETRGSNESEFGEIYSTYFVEDIQKRPEVVFLDLYRKIVSQMAIDMCFSESVFSLDYWCQVYNGSHRTHMHFCGSVPYSFVHFVRPTEDRCFYFCGSNGQKYYPRQNPGDIITFPSMALHGIDPSYGTTRMTIAGNLIFSNIKTPDSDIFTNITRIRDGLYTTEYFNRSGGTYKI
jgi:hypothetical protein